MPRNTRKSALTVDQQNHERARMMQSASKVISQLDEYVRTGAITVAGKTHSIDATRLQAYRLILDRTVPTVASKEITHKSEYEDMDTGKIVERLALLASKKPQLAAQLQEALGGRVIDAVVVDQGDSPLREEKPTGELIPRDGTPQTEQ